MSASAAKDSLREEELNGMAFATRVYEKLI